MAARIPANALNAIHREEVIQMQKQVDFTGTVSRATLRYEDLIPEFLSVLEDFWPEKAEMIEAQYAADGWPSGSGLLFDDPFNEEQLELAPFLLDELFDALAELAPDGVYFGASEGDGSDFGYWDYEEDELWDYEEDELWD